MEQSEEQRLDAIAKRVSDKEDEYQRQAKELLDELNHTCSLDEVPLKHYNKETQQRIQKILTNIWEL